MSSLEQQLSLALGGCAEDYDIPGIAADIRRVYGPVTSINEIHGPAYWAIVERHEMTERVET